MTTPSTQEPVKQDEQASQDHQSGVCMCVHACKCVCVHTCVIMGVSDFHFVCACNVHRYGVGCVNDFCQAQHSTQIGCDTATIQPKLAGFSCVVFLACTS